MRDRVAATAAAILFTVSAVACVSAEEAAVDGFSNYYRNEGTFDWSKNCRVAASLPAAGTQLPVRVPLQFIFEHDQQSLLVFQGYSRGTYFDLGVVNGSTLTYVDSRKAPTVTGPKAVVTFAPVQLDANPGQTSRLEFEIYGDCNRCGTSEALPPDRDHTTWRIYGAIEVVADASRKVVSCRFVGVGSEEPAKKLPSRDPAHYPKRKGPRPYESFKVAASGPLANPGEVAFPGVVTSNPCCIPPCGCPRACAPSCCVPRPQCCRRRACVRMPAPILRCRCSRKCDDD